MDGCHSSRSSPLSNFVAVLYQPVSLFTYLPTYLPTGAQIPLSGGVESLNAAAAGAIILSEAARQRRRRGAATA